MPPAWDEIYRRFDPFAFQIRREWRVERPHSPASKLIRLLQKQERSYRILVGGTVGTGKSTELQYIAESRSADSTVIFLDMYRHFAETMNDATALDHVSAWEVVFLVGVAAARVSRELIPNPEDATLRELVQDLLDGWRRAAGIAQTPDAAAAELDVAKLIGGLVVLASDAAAVVPGLGVGLKLLEKAADASKWSLPLGRAQKELADQQLELQSLLAATNSLLRYLTHITRPTLVVLDGLDRISDPKTAERLFVTSDLLGGLNTALLVCAPFAFRHDLSAGAPRQFEKKFVIANEPVISLQDPKQQGPGIRFFCDIYARRTEDLGVNGLIPPAALERLAYYSGGRARDFIQLVRNVAELSDLDGLPVANDAVLQEVLREARLLKERGLNDKHLALLQGILREHPKHTLPEDEEAIKLLHYGHLLPFPNDSEWFYPHPLLTLHLLATSASSGA